MEDPRDLYDRAPCRRKDELSRPVYDPDLWWPERGDNDTGIMAKSLCLKCTIRWPCLRFGLREKYGIWGALSKPDRDEVLKALRKGKNLVQAVKPIDARTKKRIEALRKRLERHTDSIGDHQEDEEER